MQAQKGIATADMIIIGKVHTIDDTNQVVEAVAISRNRVVATGRKEEVLTLKSPHTIVIDAGHRTVMPGIYDSHNHIPTAGILMDGVMLFDAKSISDMQEMVAQRAQEAPAGEWIQGGGWIESQFRENRLPTRYDLDAAAPDHPVILGRLFGMSLVNSRALELAGIDRLTPNPHRGIIDRDQDGEPTGILRSNAVQLVSRLIADPEKRETLEKTKERILRAGTEYQRWGITSAIDPGVPPLSARAYQELWQQGQLPLRVNMMPAWHGMSSDIDRDLNALGVFSGFGDAWLSLGAVKMAIDGGLGSRTALLNWPFTDNTFSAEPLRLDINRLEEYFEQVHTRGWSVGIHCCGDKAQDLSCQAFHAVNQRHGRHDTVHNIIHAYFATEESLDMMVENNIAASVQPGFIFVEGDIYFDSVEEERLRGFKPLRTYLERGILVAANSDMTSAHYNPFLGMRACLDRKTARGRVLGTEESISRTEMLRLFTINGAKLAFEEGSKGSLAIGKLADIIILSDDIMSVDTQAVGELHVQLTLLDGKIVHRHEI